MSIRLGAAIIIIVISLALNPLYPKAQNVPPTSAVASRPQLSGERLFLQCRACHSLTSDQAGKVGPPLAGIFTRGVGRMTGYDYSAGMRAYGGSWTDERLSTYLAGPNRTVTGTKMAFAGIPDEGRRAALIAYLRANTVAAPPTK
jgi:cytochrome c